MLHQDSEEDRKAESLGLKCLKRNAFYLAEPAHAGMLDNISENENTKWLKLLLK